MIYFTFKYHSLFRVKKNLILFFSFFLINTIFSQESIFQEVEAYKEFKNYKIKEITQDEFNNIWLITSRGLLKFDGVSIELRQFKGSEQSQKVNTVFSINDSLFIGKNKNLQIRTHNKVLNFDTKNINKIYKQNSHYIIGTNQGILYFKDKLLQPLITNYNLDFSIIQDIIYFKNKFILASNSGLWILSDLLKPENIVLISKGNYSSFLQIK